MAQVILGIICFQGHSASAAILKDGQILAAASEERFSRIKEDGTFPIRAIEFVLQKSNMSIENVDDIAFAWNPLRSLRSHLHHALRNMSVSFSYIFEGRAQVYSKSRAARLLDMFSLKQKFYRHFGFCPPINYVDHHLAHAASSLFQTQFDEALCFVTDGCGESTTQTAMLFRNGFKETIFETPIPHSYGIFYSAITEYLGFRPEMDEYKVMGLASYGNPQEFLAQIKKMISIDDSGGLHLDHQYLAFTRSGKNFCAETLSTMLGPVETVQAKADLASAAQKVLTECHILQLKSIKKKLPNIPSNFCGSGGVFLNCVLNQALRNSGLFSNWHFSPISADAGTAVGSAQYLYFKKTGKRPTPIKTLDLGADYTDEEIELVLTQSATAFSKVRDPELSCAKLLSDSKIIARFQGRSEFGPRALGHRSILADPRQVDVKAILNEKIKSREEFRPFGPSVLLEKFDEFFFSGGQSKSFPYMIETVMARPENLNNIPAVVHIDGTSRVQTVSDNDNPRYHRMIKFFEQFTGIPMVLNTSFNRNNEPIVNSPTEALNCFKESQLDALVIGRCLVLAPHLRNQISKYS